METVDKKDEWPPEDEVIYVSNETYRSVYRALDHMEKAREELRKAAEIKNEISKTEKDAVQHNPAI